MDSIKLLSPAKINLYLEILSRLPSGYHTLRTIMQPISIYDELSIELSDDTSLSIESSGLSVPVDESNLARVAANLYRNKARIDRGVKIKLNKKIPMGSGLGGGSSNAACVLVGLNKLTNKLDEDALFELSSTIGADVAFFIRSHTALAEGIGEKITLIREFPNLHYVVLCPRLNVSTKDIYDAWDTDHATCNRTIDPPPELNKTIEGFSRDTGKLPLRNDLETPAITKYPEIESFKNILTSLGAANILMTGSGSAVYAVFRDENEARELYDYLRTSPTFDVFYAHSIKGWHIVV